MTKYFLLLALAICSLSANALASWSGAEHYTEEALGSEQRQLVQGKQFDLLKLQSVLREMKKEAKFPNFVPNLHLPKLGPAMSSAHPAIDEDFRKISKSAFGDENFFDFYTCLEPCFSLAQSHFENRKIELSIAFVDFLKKKFGETDARNAIKFVLAHEISHYLLEATIQSSPQRLSPHGSKSLLGSPVSVKPADFDDYHAEVDAFAAAILMEMGIDPRIGIRLLSISRDAFSDLFRLALDEQSQIDFRYREESLKRSIERR